MKYAFREDPFKNNELTRFRKCHSGLTRMALPESQAALANRSRACWRGTVIRGYGLGRRLRTRGS